MAGGTLTVGSVDTSAYSGDINWVNIQLPGGYWAIPLEGVTVEGTDVSVTADAVIIDTGTTLIGAPSADVSAIFAQISDAAAVTLDGDSGYYSSACLHLGCLPHLGLTTRSLHQSPAPAPSTSPSPSAASPTTFHQSLSMRELWIRQAPPASPASLPSRPRPPSPGSLESEPLCLPPPSLLVLTCALVFLCSQCLPHGSLFGFPIQRPSRCGIRSARQWGIASLRVVVQSGSLDVVVLFPVVEHQCSGLLVNQFARSSSPRVRSCGRAVVEDGSAPQSLSVA
jgi:hypothetical protein